MARLSINPPFPSVGQDPSLMGFRNGIAPPASAMAGVYQTLDSIIAYRRQVVFRAWFEEGDIYTGATASDTWRFRFYSGLNGTRAICRMVFARVAVATTSLDPRVQWTVGGVAQDAIEVEGRNSTHVPAVPDDYVYRQQTWDLTAGTAYNCVMSQVDNVRPVGCTVWLEQKRTLRFSGDTCASPLGLIDGQPILDAKIADFVADVQTAWKAIGTHWAAWTRPGTSAFTRTVASDLNPFDSASTAWSSTAPGFQTDPYLQGSLDSNNVPSVFYAYAGYAGAGTGTIKLVRNGATLTTLTVTGANAWYTGTANLRADQSTEKYDVLIASDGTNSMSTYAAGLYEYTA